MCVCVVFSSSRRSHVASLFANKEQKKVESDLTRYGYLILFPSNTVKPLHGVKVWTGSTHRYSARYNHAMTGTPRQQEKEKEKIREDSKVDSGPQDKLTYSEHSSSVSSGISTSAKNEPVTAFRRHHYRSLLRRAGPPGAVLL